MSGITCAIDHAAATAMRVLRPELAHRVSIWGLRSGLAASLYAKRVVFPSLRTTIAGLEFDNPIGAAAGLDKQADIPDRLWRLGFGFFECGSVTPRPQPGNPGRVAFRLPAERGVINRYGFPSGGLEAFRANLAKRTTRGGVFGANIGANKDSGDRIADYVTGFEALAPLADYVAVNISSPNTPGLRALQQRAALEELLGRLAETRTALAKDGVAPPLFLKVAPDLEADEVETIAAAAEEFGVDALIVSNTTLHRPADLSSSDRDEAGGLSGRPLFSRSTEVLRDFRRATGGRVPLIGVGGVESGATAYAKIRAGASAVQLYTALVYNGPGLVRRIVTDLAALLAADGYAQVTDVVGVDTPL